MKKIMFNDKYGLTDAVLDGSKTMTRRVINLTDTDEEYLDTAFDWDLRERVIIDRYAKYKVGEIVAVAQKYKDVPNPFYGRGTERSDAIGWNNKMFVRADLMPHQIRITDIKVDRLQDISDEDCMEEGVMWDYDDYLTMSHKVYLINDHEAFSTPRQAFAALIDKVSGKGTWQRNPFVFAYEFELVK